MATRPRKKPVIDRLRDARKALETEQGVIRVHLKVCSQCHFAGDQFIRTCDEGWQLRKSEQRALMRIVRLEDEHASANRQGVLF